MTKPLITALIDTYNHEHYIEQTLNSVLEQGLSASEIEIVVVDDGSTDNTPALIQKFAPRVKHVRKTNGGQASAFNVGFSHASGEIIALLDGDDWWAKNKLATVLEALEKNPQVAAVGHGYFKYHEAAQRTETIVPPGPMVVNLDTPNAIRSWPFMLMGALTVRRKVLDWIMPIPEELTFMADSAIQAAATVMGTLILPEPLFYYRWHGQNLWAFDSQEYASPQAAASVRRRAAMAEKAYGAVSHRLLALGVPAQQVSDLLGFVWMDARRSRLSLSGGTRSETLATEMQVFRETHPNPSLFYLLFKYLVVAPSTFLFPPRRFYRLRQWYSRNLRKQ